MKDRTLKDFLRNNAKEENLCYYYDTYSNEVKKMMNNVFRMCWRIGLYTKQTLMMLDESLKPFKNKDDKMKEMFDLW